jgi:hypothetical protein
MGPEVFIKGAGKEIDVRAIHRESGFHSTADFVFSFWHDFDQFGS